MTNITNTQKVALFWTKKLFSAKSIKEKIRAMTALTAIEQQGYKPVTAILDNASNSNLQLCL